MDAHAAILPTVPDWNSVMMKSGWDNSINRMATKYAGNIKVHVTKGLLKSVENYVAAVAPEAVRNLMVEITTRRLRPLVLHDGDFELVMSLRSLLGVLPDDPTWYPPKKSPYSRDVLLFHIFLVRQGFAERSYLPVAGVNRKYAYLNTKIASALLDMTGRRRGRKEQQSKKGRGRKKQRIEKENEVEEQHIKEDENKVGEQHIDEKKATTSVGELLGITVASFNAARSKLRRLLRQQCRRNKSSREPPGKRKRRLQRLEQRWQRNGYGRLRKGTRIDSVETDGVGLRLCVKTPIDLSPFIKPVPMPSRSVGEDVPPKRKRSKKVAKAEVVPAADTSDEPATTFQPDESWGPPIIVAIDRGRAKLFTAAVSHSAIEKPITMAFTRRQYYYEMGYTRHQRWSTGRAMQTDVATALQDLSNSGGTGNGDLASWTAYLTAAKAHGDVLRNEFIVNPEYAVWRMRLFRWKRMSMSRAVQRLMFIATKGKHANRPLVFADGDAGFKSTGRGELSAPTSALSLEFKRALGRMALERPVVKMIIPEFRTTMCCCACGAVTRPPIIIKNNLPQRSGRLRECTQCKTTGKRRDRDVQGSRNIAWLAYFEYYGVERPWYLRRGHAPEVLRAGQ